MSKLFAVLLATSVFSVQAAEYDPDRARLKINQDAVGQEPYENKILRLKLPALGGPCDARAKFVFTLVKTLIDGDKVVAMSLRNGTLGCIELEATEKNDKELQRYSSAYTHGESKKIRNSSSAQVDFIVLNELYNQVAAQEKKAGHASFKVISIFLPTSAKNNIDAKHKRHITRILAANGRETRSQRKSAKKALQF